MHGKTAVIDNVKSILVDITIFNHNYTTSQMSIVRELCGKHSSFQD